MAAEYGHTKVGVLRSMLRTPGARREEREIHRVAEEKLSFFGDRLMGYRWDQPAYSLSYANRRRLEIARAMATQARILLLDEPAAGMNPRGDARDHGTDRQAPRRRRLHDPRDRARHARRRRASRTVSSPSITASRSPKARSRQLRPTRGSSRHTSACEGRRRNEHQRRRGSPQADEHRHVLRRDPHPREPGPERARRRARVAARR